MVDDLVAALDAARDDFQDALADVDADLVTVSGVVGEWSVRDLVVHVAWWAAHAVAAIDLAASGRGTEFDSSEQTDALNADVLERARSTSPDEALAQEEGAYAELRGRITALDPALLGQRLGNGDTVEEVIRCDGPDHYAEHTAHLRAWFGEDEGD